MEKMKIKFYHPVKCEGQFGKPCKLEKDFHHYTTREKNLYEAFLGCEVYTKHEKFQYYNVIHNNNKLCICNRFYSDGTPGNLTSSLKIYREIKDRGRLISEEIGEIYMDHESEKNEENEPNNIT